MTCASVELIEAMKGSPAPWMSNETGRREDTYWMCACGDYRDCSGRAYIGIPAARSAARCVYLHEDTKVVDCPRCLVLMRAATDPVRWDYLESRGLVAA